MPLLGPGVEVAADADGTWPLVEDVGRGAPVALVDGVDAQPTSRTARMTAGQRITATRRRGATSVAVT